MKNKIVLSLILVVTVAAIGCASGATTVTPSPTATLSPTPSVGGVTVTTPSKPGIISPTWITAQVEGDIVSIPVSEVNSGKMIHFEVTEQGSNMAYMAYELGGKIYVRASVCPPCRSRGFSLVGDVLDCNNCHTKFKASTGEGISGACVNYPKAEVAHEISGDKITMTMDALVTAYENTLTPGWP